MATLYYSQDSASIAGMIPAMDILTSNLDLETKQPYHPLIIAAITLARKKMNQYYSLTDDAVPYRIAMGMYLHSFLDIYLGTNLTQSVLHPGLKLEYFHLREWEKEWIEQAEKLVCEEYAASYEKAAAPEETSVESSPVQVCGTPLL